MDDIESEAQHSHYTTSDSPSPRANRGLHMAKSTKDEIIDAAKTAGQGVQSLAGQALGAAAAAAAGVVMDGVARVLGSG
jgi:hypothetical protein